MPITTLGNNTSGTTHNYVGTFYWYVAASHLAVAGDVIRKNYTVVNGQGSLNTPVTYHIVSAATNDLTTAVVVKWANVWDWWDEDGFPYTETGSDEALILTAGQYYWFGLKPAAAYIAAGTGSAAVVTTASLDSTGVTAVGTTTSSSEIIETWAEVINTANTESVTVVSPDTGSGSLLQGESGITTIYYYDCSSIYGLITVNANGTFTSDRPGDQTFDYKLDGGTWQTCTINDQVDGI